MTIIFLLITIIIGIMAMFTGIGYGDLIGFASLLVTILIFYSNAINRQRKYNTEHELKISNIYADLLELKTRDKELELKIKEMGESKMNITMCTLNHTHTQEAINEIKEMIKTHQIEITELIKKR